MLRMFFRAVIITAIAIATQVSSEPSVGIVISTQPESFSENIFIGDDCKMPADGSKVLSLTPTIVSGNILIPSTISEALVELTKLVPTWYGVAMKNASHEYECTVVVNGQSFDVPVFSWVEVNWNLRDAKSPLGESLRTELNMCASEHIASRLQDLFCAYLSTEDIYMAVQETRSKNICQ